MKTASKNANARSVRNRASTLKCYYTEHIIDVAIFAVANARNSCANIFFWQSGRQCTGMAAVPLQHNTGRDQREEESEENQL